MTPWEAVERALDERVRSGRSLVVVAGPTAARLAPSPRVVTVSGARALPAVAAGLRVAGEQVVVLTAGPVDPPAVPSPRGVIVCTPALDVARRLWAAGWCAVQPAWVADVVDLLDAALAENGPVVLRCHNLPGGPEAPALASPPVLRAPRVLRPGHLGSVAASGPAARHLPALAQALADRGVPVEAAQLTTLLPTDPFPAEADDHLYVVGRPDGAGGGVGGFHPVSLGDGIVSATEAVLELLRVPV